MANDSRQNLDFKIFEGPACEQMPKLIAVGLVPASAAKIMRGRLEGKLLLDEYYDSGDAVIYHPGGEVELVFDSEDLRKLNTESQMSSSGALVLPGYALGSVGRVLSMEQVKRYASDKQPKDRVKENLFWQWLARDDQHLLGEYADQMFGSVKERYGYTEAMGVYAHGPIGSVPVLRLWCLGGDGSGGADGYLRLDYFDSRLVGVLQAQSIFGYED